MELRSILFYTVLNAFVCMCVENSVTQISGVIGENGSWFETKLVEYPSLRYEIHMSFNFTKKACCPVVNLRDTNLRDTFDENVLPGIMYGGINCFWTEESTLQIVWDKGNTFILPNNTQNNGNCQLSFGNYICNISTVNLNFEPKVRWMALGYLCGEEKNLTGFQYEYKVNVQNTTRCERIQKPENIDYFQCNRFYNYTTFPNLFGHPSQDEAFDILEMFQKATEHMDHSCHKHLDYILCQVFFPRCPDETSENNRMASYLNVICEEMCKEALAACYTTLPFTNFVNCSYYVKLSNINCTYKPATCNSPPAISNGQIITGSTSHHNNVTYPIGSVVKYSCHRDYELKGNNTVVCQYSGHWKSLIDCESKIHIKITIIGILFGTGMLMIIVLAFYVRIRQKKRKRRAQYFENIPLQKRNKENDAFVSFFGDDGPDYDFVKNVLQPKLEEESDPPFKLTIHLRDFRADTLIYVNIRNAVINSNSAIILMSQAYIDARWCREEFEVILIF